MKGYITAAATLLATITLGATSIFSVNHGGDGKKIFLDNKCSNCHSIESQGIVGRRPEGGAKPSDLSNEGSKFKSEWFEKWLMKEETLYNKKHMKKFRGSQKDLRTLALWLASLKVEEKK